MRSILASMCPRSPSVSMAPLLISASRVFLLITSEPVLCTKSSSDTYGLSSRPCNIVPIGPSPTHLIALSPKRIFVLSMYVKCLRDSLTSGTRTWIPFDFASLISSTMRSVSSSSDTMSAVRNSVG